MSAPRADAQGEMPWDLCACVFTPRATIRRGDAGYYILQDMHVRTLADDAQRETHYTLFQDVHVRTLVSKGRCLQLWNTHVRTLGCNAQGETQYVTIPVGLHLEILRKLFK